MVIIKLDYDKYFIEDINRFLSKNNFEYFDPHKNKSVENSLLGVVKDVYKGIYFNGELIAYGMLRGMDEGYSTPMLGIAVDKRYEGIGVGKLLMQFLEVETKLLEYKEIKLRVHKDNIRARNVYKKLGYKVVAKGTDIYTLRKFVW